MPQTDTESTAVWGLPILFEIKLTAYRYRDFCSGRHMIEICPNLICLTAETRFILFKGPGSFKSLKNFGKVEDYKTYQLIPSMTPLFNGWTIPLKSCSAEIIDTWHQ
jgi:hypothetical protein